jgi:translation initiation factor 3 subunit C
MSRFWAGDDSGSSSDSDSGSGSESEQEKKVQTNRWAAVSDSDSSDEGERVVRSAKDKAWDGMKAVVSKISNARKINDWHEMQTQFDLLNKQVETSAENSLQFEACRGRREVLRIARRSCPSLS